MNFSRYEKEIRSLTIFLLGAALLAPILVGPRFLFPYVFPKAVFFQALTELALILYILLLAIDRRYLPPRTAVFWGVLLYVGVIALSIFFGADRSLAFWSKAERMDGVFQYLHLLVYFFILTGVVRSEKDWLKLLKATLFIGLINGFLAIAAKFSWINLGNQERLGATFGNPAFLATYYIILIFFALTFLLHEKTPTKRLLFGSFFLFFLLLLILSGTRGAYIGFIAGIASVVLALIFSDWRRWKKLALGVALAAVIFLGVLYFGQDALKAQSKFLRERVYTTFEFPAARLVSWKIALEAFKARPLFGWGQENYIYAFNTHFDPEIHTYELSLFDRAHNKILDLLVMNGIPGLLAYLFFFGAMAFPLVRTLRQKNVNPVWPAGLLGLVAAYLVQNLVLFEMPSSGLMLFFFAGFISWLGSQEKTRGEQVERTPARVMSLFPQWVVISTAIFVGIIFTIGIWQPIGAARATVSVVAEISNPYIELENRFRSAQTLYQETRGARSTFLDKEFDLIVSRRLRDLPSPSQMAASSPAFREFTEDLIANLWQDYDKHPLDYDILTEIGNLYFIMQVAKPEYTLKTYETFEQAKALAPRREDAYQQIALWYIAVGNLEKADEEFQKLFALNDKVGRFWWVRAIYEIAAKNPKGVEEALQNAEKYNFDWRALPQLSFLAARLEGTGNIGEAMKYYGILAERYATSSFDITLASLEKVFSLGRSSGLRNQALSIKNRILELAPSESTRIEEVASRYGF